MPCSALHSVCLPFDAGQVANSLFIRAFLLITAAGCVGKQGQWLRWDQTVNLQHTRNNEYGLIRVILHMNTKPKSQTSIFPGPHSGLIQPWVRGTRQDLQNQMHIWISQLNSNRWDKHRTGGRPSWHSLLVETLEGLAGGIITLQW